MTSFVIAVACHLREPIENTYTHTQKKRKIDNFAVEHSQHIIQAWHVRRKCEPSRETETERRKMKRWWSIEGWKEKQSKAKKILLAILNVLNCAYFRTVLHENLSYTKDLFYTDASHTFFTWNTNFKKGKKYVRLHSNFFFIMRYCCTALVVVDIVVILVHYHISYEIPKLWRKFTHFSKVFSFLLSLN